MCITDHHRELDLEPLVEAVRSLEALAYERTNTSLQRESDDIPSDSADASPRPLPYDPASVFLLEMMVSIVCKTPAHIEELWCVSVLVASTRLTVS